MNETLERVLMEALDLLEQGLSVEEVTVRYPDQAAELRPFLQTAVALSNLATQPTLTAQVESKRAFLVAADGRKAARPVGSSLRRFFAPALALLAVLFLAGVGLVGASGSAVPGDALYETRLLIEEARLRLASDPARAAELREQFRLQRIREIEQLLASGQSADVSLTGIIQAIDGDRWTVAGLPVDVSGAAVDGNPSVGALVQVDGRTEDGVVAGRQVLVLAAVPPTPTPTATQEPSPTATLDDEDDAALDDEDISTRTPGAMATAGQPTVTPTFTATPTSTPQPTLSAPTATPSDDNNNDNGDDNEGNDNNDNTNDNGDNGNDNGDDSDNDNAGSGNDNDGENGNDNSDDNSNDNADDDNDGDNENGNDNDSEDDNGNNNDNEGGNNNGGEGGGGD